MMTNVLASRWPEEGVPTRGIGVTFVDGRRIEWRVHERFDQRLGKEPIVQERRGGRKLEIHELFQRGIPGATYPDGIS